MHPREMMEGDVLLWPLLFLPSRKGHEPPSFRVSSFLPFPPGSDRSSSFLSLFLPPSVASVFFSEEGRQQVRACCTGAFFFLFSFFILIAKNRGDLPRLFSPPRWYAA